MAKTINTKKKEEHATLAETVAPLFFSLVDLMDLTDVVEDPLREHCLPEVDVHGDADIPHPAYQLPPLCRRR